MKYRKKPVVIDAFRLGSDFVPDWFVERVHTKEIIIGEEPNRRPFADIKTLEGTMRANDGDYIIRGVKGEIYPCKPDIFGATYEPVELERLQEMSQT